MLTDMISPSSRETLETRSGLHTYVGCSVEEDSSLRLVSYINPRQSCMAGAARVKTTQESTANVTY